MTNFLDISKNCQRPTTAILRFALKERDNLSNKVSERAKQYYEVNKDKVSERAKRWKKDNPDKLKFYAHRRGAKKISTCDGTVTESFF